MTETKHTPGPLYISATAHEVAETFGLKDPWGGWVAKVHPLNGTESDRLEANRNARLLTAAYNSYDKHCTSPVEAAEADLLGEALDALMLLMGDIDQGAAPADAECRMRTGSYDKARAILSKAKGSGQ